MKIRLLSTGILVAAIVSLAWFSSATFRHGTFISPDEPPLEPVATNTATYGLIPIHFESNIGQVSDSVKFLSRGAGYSLFLTNEEAVLALQKTKAADSDTPQADVLRMTFTGANYGATMAGEKLLDGKTNYITGNDPDGWKTNIANFQRVRYSNIYEGIDVVYYGSGQQLEYDLVVGPGTSPDKIGLKFDGTQDVSIADNGDLVLKFDGNEVLQHRPVAYQDIDSQRIEVAANYVISNLESRTSSPEIGFEVGEYDHSQPLIIDPVLSYSTYLGGGDETVGTSIAVDSAGSAYVTGYTNALDFPLAGSFQQANNGGTAGFITKLNPAGTAFVYSTYLGGNSRTFPSSIKVDTAGSAYVGGWTLSSNFPTTAGAYRVTPPPGGGRPSFVTKLSPTGSSLSYSTYLAGVNDLTGLALDLAGSAYVTGYTQDALFPTTPGAYKTTLGVGIIENAFVTKLNPTGSMLLYSTFVGAAAPFDGGQPNDQATAIAVDTSGNAYITGTSVSNNYPITSGAFQIFPGGRRDAFITKLNASGSALVYSTYLGGGGQDRGTGIAVDSTGNAYVTGSFENDDFPLTLDSFLPTTTTNGGSFGLAFLTKVNPTGTALIYSTALGYRTTMAASGVAVGSDGSAYVIGSEGGGMGGYAVNAIQSASHSNDAWLLKMNPAGTGLAFASPVGGNGLGNNSTSGAAIAIDAAGNAYVTGRTQESDFPTTAGAAQAAKPGGGVNSAFITKIGVQAGDCPAIAVSPQPLPVAIYNQSYANQLAATGGVAPYTFSLVSSFSNNLLPFGLTLAPDGQISGTPTNQSFGTYLTTVQAADSNGCVGTRTLKLVYKRLSPRTRGLYLKVVARPVVRIGNEYTFYLTYANRSATPATNVPLLLRVPDDISLHLKFAQPNRTSSARGYNLLRLTLPNIPANSDLRELPFTIKATNPNRDNETFGIDAFVTEFPLIVTTTQPTRSSSAIEDVQITREADRDLRISDLWTAHRPDGNECSGAFIVDPAFGWLCRPPGVGGLGGFEDADNPCPDGDYPVYNAYPRDQPNCVPIPPTPCLDENIFDDGCNTETVKKGKPSDPNEKTGSSGVGASHYYTGDVGLPYAVSFENVATATLPAQDVVVDDQLDPNVFDLTTFSFNLIAFGDRQVSPQIGVKQFTTDIDLRPAKQAIVRVNGNFNTSSGLITWRFNTLDPATGLPPEDPDAGFLPPNKTSPEGQGTLFFTVKAKAGLPTGTQLKNKARIVFDVNAPIVTPEWLNTIDTAKPTSSVQSLPANSSTNFTLNWTGSDTGSGVKTYTIYVSADGGAFVPYLTDTPDTSVVVTLIEANHTLRFYSIARDAVGNEEPSKTNAEATTTVVNAYSVSGRAFTSTGLGLKNAVVSITGSDGLKRSVISNSFGVYQFDNVLAADNYTISVTSKRFRFSSRVVNVTAALTNVDFTGLE